MNGQQQAHEYKIYTMKTGGEQPPQASLGAGRYPSWGPEIK